LAASLILNRREHSGRNVVINMLTIKGIYDGKKIEPSEEIPFTEKRNVLITFLEELSKETGIESEIDPIKALRGSAIGLDLTEKLLKSRKSDL
jgi:hypothetical protein